MGTSSHFEVVQKVTRRIESALSEDRTQSWESVRDRIKADFADEFRVLYNRALIRSPDGSDLIAEVVGGIAPQVRSDTVREMRDALVFAVENAPRVGALWSSTRQDIICENNAAIGMLAQYDQSAQDGDALLNGALQELRGRVWLVDRCDVVPGRKVKYLTNQPPECGKSNKCNGGEPKNGGWQILPILKWVAALLSIAAAIATLIGVTVWDILPIPCDLPIFSWLPRC